jgi:hypothetical protein
MTGKLGLLLITLRKPGVWRTVIRMRGNFCTSHAKHRDALLKDNGLIDAVFAAPGLA